MNWIVENDVPIPPKKQSVQKKRETYISPIGAVIKSLNVNQSVIIHGEDFMKIRQICQGRKRNKGMRYVTREADGGLRVWRVE